MDLLKASATKLNKLICLIKDIFVDIVEGNLTRQEWLALYSCVIIFTIFFIVGVAS